MLNAGELFLFSFSRASRGVLGNT